MGGPGSSLCPPPLAPAFLDGHGSTIFLNRDGSATIQRDSRKYSFAIGRLFHHGHGLSWGIGKDKHKGQKIQHEGQHPEEGHCCHIGCDVHGDA